MQAHDNPEVKTKRSAAQSACPLRAGRMDAATDIDACGAPKTARRF